MRILVTGHLGFIGPIMTRKFIEADHEVIGIDSDLYRGCDFGGGPTEVRSIRRDIRDIQVEDLEGVDAIAHLAALSNDPVGDLDPACTYAINYEATVRLGRLAKEAGVRRFVFSSSCSVYGASEGESLLDENAPRKPVTAYGVTKAKAEDELAELAEADFAPTFLRNATAYGLSPRLRSDLVVNNLTGHAFLSGRVLLKSDGRAWRPIVHIQDIAQAFLAVLEAPIDQVRNAVFNVGRNDENYRIGELAELAASIVPKSRIEYAPGGSTDVRCYRVDCSRIQRVLPSYAPQWDARQGITELYEAYRRHGLTMSDFEGDRFVRIKHLRALMDRGLLDASLRLTDGQLETAMSA